MTPTDLRERAQRARPLHSFNDIPDRKARLAEMLGVVARGMSSWHEPDAWTRYLDGLARFPRLSPANILLVLDQQPHATWLSTHRGWQAQQRRTIERGIAVLTPSMRVKRENGRPVWDGGRLVVEEAWHRPATMFDYTATSGAQLERPWSKLSEGAPVGFVDDLRAAAAALGYAVESRRDAAPTSRRVLTLIHGQSEEQKAWGLARALGAVASGSVGADVFAYALCHGSGFATPAPAVPQDPAAAVSAARAGLQRVLLRTSFRSLL
jgi:hypothetical protein